MVRCFHLGNVPQGLKALSKRELGMEMEDFDDVVTPYSRPKVITYFADGVNCDWPKPPAVMERQKDGTIKIKQPHSMKSLLKLFFTHLNVGQELGRPTQTDGGSNRQTVPWQVHHTRGRAGLATSVEICLPRR
jgi:hypothetical protein